MPPHPPERPLNIGFVAKRVAGTDGVSLESAKWAEILERLGHTCYYVAGESDRPPERTLIVPEAHFKHPVIAEINQQCFGRETRTLEVTRKIHEMTWVIKQKLHAALRQFALDVIIAENCVTIPMNIPLGVAVVQMIMETGIGCIAHHHDFVWERERYLVNAVEDYLRTAFPPSLAKVQHVVINSQASREFSRRTGLSCRVIPNVMDFENPPPPPDEYARGFRAAVGLEPGDRLILQPTRIVQRKGIEHSIELIRHLDDPRAKLVVTHASGDEGDAYALRIRRYADLLGVELVLAAPWIAPRRGVDSQGRRQFTIQDAYSQADLVTYPSSYEGFGNAFLEAVYYKLPILCNRYAIYRTDIEPCGFRTILMDGFLTDEVVEQVRRVLEDSQSARELVEHNYEAGRQFFSYATAEAELRSILARPRFVHPEGRSGG